MRSLLIAAFLLSLAGCGEREQVVEQQSEKRYQGKHDGKPWDNAPLAQEFRGSTWNKGDPKSWEERVKQRQLSQDEYKRIYQ